MVRDRCYILGAGASYGYNSDLPFNDLPPLTDGLVKRGVELGIIPHPDFYTFCRGLRKFAKVRRSLPVTNLRYWEYDLEKALDWFVKTFDAALQGSLRTSPGSKERQRYDSVLEWTQSALSQSFYFLYELLRQCTLDATIGSDAYTRLSSRSDDNYTVLTLNYDTIHERALDSLGIDYHYVPQHSDPESVPIAKLHGSINWVNRGLAALPRRVDRYRFPQLVTPVYSNKFHMRNPDILSQAQLARTPYYKLATSGDSVDEPGLVPPIGSKEKVDKISMYGDVWDYAAELIQDASEFVIIGCSLRSDDKAFRNLLSDNARQNPEITVVKHSPSKITEDVNAIFGNPVWNEPYRSFEAYTDDL